MRSMDNLIFIAKHKTQYFYNRTRYRPNEKDDIWFGFHINQVKLSFIHCLIGLIND